ncbi:hypothetical protein SAMN02745206_02183 [Desulfacinum infernum DSM 9756]|uniref:Autotransporter domain-containing protein n=1 Tax=Desulfacinum infernum DSM 9756 TaxID=1121391 RepID=A0A1M5CF65_9BACT|nr:autotransporter outer membrane beta-barrel domain-containing protein [Desulfacinum infernum]SHF53339.1 hypothetical protein SAMN02745206_02183 [Desulfacinum infernum DSM 9756]
MKKKVMLCITTLFLLLFAAQVAVADRTVEVEIPDTQTSYVNSGTLDLSEFDSSLSKISTVFAEPSATALDFYNQASGIIRASATVGSATSDDVFAQPFGVQIGYEEDDTYYTRNVGTFENHGWISADGTCGDANAYADIDDGDEVDNDAITIYGTVETFLNTGTISAVATSGSALNGGELDLDPDGVDFNLWVNSFENSGTIMSTARSGDATGSDSRLDPDAEGVNFDDGVTTFSNLTNGIISASATAGNATNGGRIDADINGIDFSDGVVVDSFANEGTISASATTGGGNNATIYVDSKGIDFDDGTVHLFANTGSISTSAATNDMSRTLIDLNSYGIDFESATVGTFSNSGTIFAASTSGNSTSGNSSLQAAGLLAHSFSSFTNSGAISALASVGDSFDLSAVFTFTWGTLSYDSVGTFTNRGTISASASTGDAHSSWVEVYSYGSVFWDTVDTFSNSGMISASTTTGDANVSEIFAESVGLNVSGTVGTFTNTGTISALTAAGKNGGDGRIYVEASGVITHSPVTSMTNSGTVETSSFAVAGDRVSSQSVAFSINQVDSFTNTGTIRSSAIADGCAEVSNSVESYGVESTHLGDFTNAGDIDVYAEAIFSNESEDVSIESAGVLVEGARSVEDFLNTGTIHVEAFANGTAAAHLELSAYAAYLTALGNFTNTGTIQVDVTDGFGADVIDTAALAVKYSDDATVVNHGTMKVALDLPSDIQEDAVNAAVFQVSGSNVTLTNDGFTWVESNVTVPNLRTLTIADSSVVTLEDAFAITFGTPGITPDTRPIFVEEASSIDLNGATLIARADSRNIRLNVPYYLLQSDDEDGVQNQWGGLEKGFTNSQFTVNWYGEDRGTNSAVIFQYQPSPDSIGPALGTLGGNLLIANFHQLFVLTAPFTSPFFAKAEEMQPILLAAGAVSDASPFYGRKLEQNRSFWAMPLYAYVSDSGIGFDSESYGLALGAGGQITDAFSMNVYAGVVDSDIDYNVEGASTGDQEILLGGITTQYRMTDKYYVRMNAEAYKAGNDYAGRTGFNYYLRETADYDSWGVSAEVVAGGVFAVREGWIFPELGVSFGHHEAESFWTTVEADTSFERRYEPDDTNTWKLIAGLNGLVPFGGNNHFYGLVRLEHALGDNDISVVNWIRGDSTARTKLEKDVAATTVTSQVGVNLRVRENLSLDLGLRTDFNADYEAFAGKLRLKYLF